jgi:hypothetical protein
MVYGLKHFLKVEGYENAEAMCEVLMDDPIGAMNAVCTACGTTWEMEPDQDRGYCDECEQNQVKAVQIIMGVI